jgi:hypothetical protein
MGRNSCKTDRCKKLMKWIDGARGGGIGGGEEGAFFFLPHVERRYWLDGKSPHVQLAIGAHPESCLLLSPASHTHTHTHNSFLRPEKEPAGAN